MLGINCIKLIFGYLYFSSSTFPKIYQKLDGQLEIRLHVVRDMGVCQGRNYPCHNLYRVSFSINVTHILLQVYMA